MEKKFFAKYLPTEGEPIEGELGWSVDNTVHVYHDSYNEKGEWKKVKLFLCSYKSQMKIAPISREAKWVKEGMEFSEDEIQSSNELRWGKEYTWSKDEILCYKIRCNNCNTFH